MKKKNNRRYKRYSYEERRDYYQKKYAKDGSAYAYGYLSGMKGVGLSADSSEHEKKGNEAGLRFWQKLKKKKI